MPLNSTDTLLEVFRGSPFHLDKESVDWVRGVFASLDDQERLRQLFVLAQIGDDSGLADSISAFAPGGVVRSPGRDTDSALAMTQRACAGARVPLLVAGDLEGGVNHPASFPATPNAMAVGAAGNPTLSAELATQVAWDAKKQGFNWSLGPVIDLSLNFRSAIVGTRSFGRDPIHVAALASAQVQALQAHGVAATIKHWPGDGVDDRDQHLGTTVNALPWEQWQTTYGDLYRSLIATGALSIMAGHIALPAWPPVGTSVTTADRYLPATARAALNVDLLRGTLGFSGVIVSDALPMAGFSSAVCDEDRAVTALLSGCDALLFSPDPEGDLCRLIEAMKVGRLPRERVESAVLRILAMKAALGLHRVDHQTAGAVGADPPTERQALFERLAAASVTKVKDRGNLLPLDPVRHRRILIMVQQPKLLAPGQDPVDLSPLLDGLRVHGFEVRVLTGSDTLPSLVGESDALLYILLQESYLTIGRMTIDWDRLHGGFPLGMARPWHHKPVVMVSFGHPYYLYDVPAMPCYVNAYVATPETQRTVAECLVGKRRFVGQSPIDPFCELAQARL